jgi:hypothetical protein
MTHHVKQTVVVDQAVVANRGHRHTGFIEFAGVGFTFIAQDIGSRLFAPGPVADP